MRFTREIAIPDGISLEDAEMAVRRDILQASGGPWVYLEEETLDRVIGYSCALRKDGSFLLLEWNCIEDLPLWKGGSPRDLFEVVPFRIHPGFRRRIPDGQVSSRDFVLRREK